MPKTRKDRANAARKAKFWAAEDSFVRVSRSSDKPNCSETKLGSGMIEEIGSVFQTAPFVCPAVHSFAGARPGNVK
jgi:hypothetical protein